MSRMTIRVPHSSGRTAAVRGMAVLVAATLASAMVTTAAHGDDEAADATYTLERLSLIHI